MIKTDRAAILITGGTGSIGNALVQKLLEDSNARKIVIFSRDELKQHRMREKFQYDKRLRWLIGDIRDLDRLKRAFHGIDFVVHAAALKQVDAGEYNPTEFIKTNINGCQNVIDAAIDTGVKKIVALSTDKASSPINLYGATKLTGDKLFVNANNYSDSYGTNFSVVRYGNVLGSRGSVLPLWKSLAAIGKPLPITDARMTRFWITLEHAVEFILESFDLMQGGEIYVPRIPSMKLLDLVQAIAPGSILNEIGIRPGEKLHEEMISEDDARRTIRINDRYIVQPTAAEWGYNPEIGEKFPEGFAYRSDTNDLWLGPEQILNFINE